MTTPGRLLSFSMRLGSRGKVAWIQQNASIASVLTPDLASKMQWIGSPRYCLAAVSTDRLVNNNTVTLDWRIACKIKNIYL